MNQLTHKSLLDTSGRARCQKGHTWETSLRIMNITISFRPMMPPESVGYDDIEKPECPVCGESWWDIFVAPRE